MHFLGQSQVPLKCLSICYRRLFLTYGLYWTGFITDSCIQHSWVSADRQISVCLGRACTDQDMGKQDGAQILFPCRRVSTGGEKDRDQERDRDGCSRCAGGRAQRWGEQGDSPSLHRSQSERILPVLACCCAQTNRLWILSKRQAECLAHQQPVFPTGKWPVAKGRAFKETTKFYTHTIHVANNFRKPKEHGAFMTGWGWAGCTAAASSSSHYLRSSFAEMMSCIYKLGRADQGTALTEGKEQAVVRNCSAQKWLY